jgi:ribonuclease BN (tRNA processing enzyme)
VPEQPAVAVFASLLDHLGAAVAFEIEVLGSEPAWPSAMRASSGYLVRTAQGKVLLDCGTGVFARLRGVIPPEELTAIVISHLHFDHWVDLLPFRYYLNYETRPKVRPALHFPPGSVEKMQTIGEQVDPGPRFFSGVFSTSEYDPRTRLHIADLCITFRKTRHPINTYAFRLVCEGRTVVYSSDTGWDESLADFVRDTDLFICDANWGAGEGNRDIHLSAAEAGRLATLAGARKLLLSHLAESEAHDAVLAARREYRGPVEYAVAGQIYRL